jgi:hypothetical protein
MTRSAPTPQSLVAIGLANGWLKKPVPVPVTPELVQRRSLIRESMRRLRANRHAQGLTSVGTERIKKVKVYVLC